MNKLKKQKNIAEEKSQPIENTDPEQVKPFSEKARNFAYEVVSVFLTAVILIMLLFTFGVRFVSVVGSSMEPTLHTSDWVLLSQAKYTPSYGDIVVISQPNTYGENIIKRVIATEGQTVNINFQTGQVYIDGAEIYEPYILNSTINSYDLEFPLTVPENHVFVMGDNRQGSIDSRASAIGFIRTEYILGKADVALTDEGYTDIGL